MVMMKTSGDIEARNKLLFLRDFYLELALLWLLAVAIGTVVLHVAAIPKFLLTTTPGIVVLTLALVAPFAVLFPLFRYIENLRVIAILLNLTYVLTAFAAGLLCSFPMGKYFLLEFTLVSVAFVTLTLYASWAAARGHDVSFLGPFLMVSIVVLIVFALIQIFIPDDTWVETIPALLIAIIFTGYIIYKTSNDPIKRCNPSPQHCESLPVPGVLGKNGGQ